MDASAASDAGDPVSDAAADAGAPQVELVITTQHGQIQGGLSDGVRTFLGIPFATPPLGEKRWTAPAPAAAWSGVRPAQKYAPICSQNNPSGGAFDATSSEDCLYLNVWAPSVTASAKLPVMVWIYGGAYVFGSGGPPYNGEKLVKAGNVIVVTMNYRLGPLGYLAHPGISAAAAQGRGAKANFGVLDQRLALQWVQENIEAFGGDKTNVTIFGESAGGNGVTVHLLSEGSWPLFRRAIVQSGLVLKPGLTLQEAEAQGSRVAVALGCAQTDPAAALACLRTLPASQVTKGTGKGFEAAGGLFYQASGMSDIFTPVIDGELLKEQPELAFASGHVARVPVLHGVTADEGMLFHMGIFGDRLPSNASEYQTLLSNRFGSAAAARIMERYPSFTTDLTTISNDAVFRCGTARMARYLSNHGISHYLYRFELALETSFAPLKDKAFHSADLPYVFGNSYLLGSVPAQKLPISRAIMGYWTRFARTGDPNGEGAPTWPPYDNTSTMQLNLADPIVSANDLRVGCEFWDDVPVSAP